MTIKEYIENPAGKGDSSFNRAATISMLNEKYENLIKEKKIKIRVYKQMTTGAYFVHLIIPTETERDNTYDVVYYFYQDKDNKKPHVKDYQVKFFANTPSFAYTFLNVYHKNGLFIESLKEKFDKIFFTDEPKVRNKFGIVNYDKYLYFGAKYIMDSHILSKGSLELRAVNYIKQTMNSTIRDFDTIMHQYRKAENKLKEKKGKEVKKAKADARALDDNKKVQPMVRKANKIKAKKPVKKPVKRVTKK